MLRKLISFSFLWIYLCLPLQAQKLAEQIEGLLHDLPKGSEVGISIYDLTDKKQVYQYRQEKL
ncbi:MAG: peptidase M15, partial [Bacteroidales bacterium]|nr:peptidase M15 [Bacteroidales bacterium]